eukprot:365619-Chlamydomonas_euryale.AAC.5
MRRAQQEADDKSSLHLGPHVCVTWRCYSRPGRCRRLFAFVSISVVRAGPAGPSAARAGLLQSSCRAY